VKRTILVMVAGLALAAVPAAAAPPTLSLKAAPVVLTYAGSTALSGSLTPAKANQKVDIVAQDCGQGGFKKQLTVKTTATGGFSATLTPTMNTNYQAKMGKTTSAAVSVKVAPLVELRATNSRTLRHFTVAVTAAQTFKGKYVVFQRRNARKHKWSTIKKVTLNTETKAKVPTIVTSQGFTVRIKGHPLARAILPATQVGTCYLPGKSKAVRS
jgi:hypothetical protein